MMNNIPLVALFALALPGCVVQVHSAEDTRVLEDTITSVALDVDSGGVTVLPSENEHVTVYRSAEWSAVPPEMSLEVVDGVLRLSSSCAAGQLVCRAEHELHLPAGLLVEGVVGSGGFMAERFVGGINLNIGSGGAVLADGEGAITLEIGSGGAMIDGHQGEVTLDVGSGGAALSEVTGDLNLLVSSGGVVADGLSAGSVVAEISSGGLSLDFDERPTLIDAEVSSGGATVEVPAGAYRLDLTASSGGINVDGVEHDPESADLIRLNVSSGGITLEGDDDR